MFSTCKGMSGKWRRLAYYDITHNTSVTCPGELQLKLHPRSCISPLIFPGCSSVVFANYRIAYSRVCGRIISFQYGHPDGLLSTSGDSLRFSYVNIDYMYVDGVSLTHGESSSRRHIWTFLALDNLWSAKCLKCACNRPKCVDSNHYTCLIINSCSSLLCQKIHWNSTFYKELPYSTTDNMEMRVCRDQDRNYEDTLIH